MSQILRIAEEADAESHGIETQKINTESNQDVKVEKEKAEETNQKGTLSKKKIFLIISAVLVSPLAFITLMDSNLKETAMVKISEAKNMVSEMMTTENEPSETENKIDIFEFKIQSLEMSLEKISDLLTRQEEAISAINTNIKNNSLAILNLENKTNSNSERIIANTKTSIENFDLITKAKQLMNDDRNETVEKIKGMEIHFNRKLKSLEKKQEKLISKQTQKPAIKKEQKPRTAKTQPVTKVKNTENAIKNVSTMGGLYFHSMQNWGSEKIATLHDGIYSAVQVSEGDRIGPFTVIKITASHVVYHDASENKKYNLIKQG